MRAWLITAFVLAGCLRGPAPALDADHKRRSAARTAWKERLLAGDYAGAAEAAWKGKLDPTLIGEALRHARKDADAKFERFAADRYSSDGRLRNDAWFAIRAEVRIACRYGPTPEAAAMAINDVLAAFLRIDDEAFRQLLLEFECPVTDMLRDDIITSASYVGDDAFAFRHILKAEWSAERKTAFVGGYFSGGYVGFRGLYFYVRAQCDRGLHAVAALRTPPDAVVPMIERADCEVGTFDPSAWQLPQSDARRYFFAATRSEEFDLAYALAVNAHMGDDALVYLYQEMLRGHWEYKLKAFLVRHPEQLENALGYALAHDELRAVGHLATTGEWVRRAFDRALELKLYMDATLIAEAGCDEAFQLEGPVLAFKAALDAKEFVTARALAKRNAHLIDKEDARKASDGYYDWLSKRPLPKTVRPKRKKRKLPKCSEEWEVDPEPCRK